MAKSAAVANNDIGRTLVYIVAFDVAEKIEVALLEQLAGLLHHLVALDVLLADVEQADSRPVLMLYGRIKQVGHDAELKEMLRFAINVCTQVEDIGVATKGG